ncbi:hypothetical protein [Kitasatospora sp. GP82]|uniref:hypothetical protein n=1 Tax=Kitasatospora sp. GP82 TaxID=3035089 RepID=UPI002475DBFE|nr:hypothetical protein [Kitasatospora sp. GP82]MDH6126423.1 hypothetical protein [Kitasatospora sp. GP82]
MLSVLVSRTPDADANASPNSGQSPAPPAGDRPLRMALSVRCPTPGIAVDPHFAAAVRDTGRHLAQAGHRVARAEAPYPWWLGAASVGRRLAGAAADARGLDPNLLNARTRRHTAIGRAVARAGLVRPSQRTCWQQSLDRLFAQFPRAPDVVQG